MLVGTQMLAKGHDFPALSTVVALNVDGGLYSPDFRASEMLFAQLLQVAGRAGRAELKGEVLIQTQYPDHPLFAAVVAHDYPGFAGEQLKEREQAGFPPYAFQAMLRAEAPQMADAIAFLKAAAALPEVAEHGNVLIYDPVPMRMTRLARRERAQLLVESDQRGPLQAFLADWVAVLYRQRTARELRWQLDVDPLEV